jgi:hypothetical protein
VETPSPAAAWDEILAASKTTRVGQNKGYAARARRFLQDAGPDAFRPAAERAVALVEALGGRCHYRSVMLALAAYVVACRRHGAEVGKRLPGLLLPKVEWLEAWELLDVAGESLRACDPAEVDRFAFVEPLHVRLIGYVGGADRAGRLVSEIRSWPKGAFTALKEKAQAAGHERLVIAQRLGYDAKEFAANVTEGLVAFGQDAVEPLEQALEAGTAHDALLLAALATIGGPRAASRVARELASATAGRRTAALAAWHCLPADDAGPALVQARAQARGAALRALDALAAPAHDDGAGRALDDSNGEAWSTMGVSLSTLDALLAWWVRHMASASWYSPRPAFANGLKALASLDGAADRAVAVLERVDENASETIDALLDAFGARVHDKLEAVLREGRAKDEEGVLRRLEYRGLLSARSLIEVGASERLAVREQAFQLLLTRKEGARAEVVAAVSHASPRVRAIAARIVEVHRFAEAEAPLRAAAACESNGPARFIQGRAIALFELARDGALSADRIDQVLARFGNEPCPEHVAGRGPAQLLWRTGAPVSPAALRGFLACAGVEDELAPSPLAHLAARNLDAASADAWAEALFLEKPNMAKKAESFRAFASVMCMSAQRLEAFAKRVRRRTASPLYRHIDAMLARRGLS